ncbi:MAG: YceI family protein [Cyclobacteriaceae bacterium]|nr:YceI family protein [Cyclobacteriaceae bacterium]
MKKNLLFSLLFLTALGAGAQDWTVDKSHAKLGFSITHLMISDVEGSFRTYEAKITSSKDDYSDAVFEISADIAGIDTDSEGRDKDLQSEKYFDAAKFPKLTFKSTSFTKVEGNKYKLVGDLTMKGITKPVELQVIINGPIDRRGKKVIGLKATGTFKRTDFNVGGPGGNMISEEVNLIANGEFVKG